MMHLCRELFPTLLEEPGVLSKLLLEHFEPSRFLCKDILENNLEFEFKNFIYDIYPREKEYKVIDIKSPEEMLKKVHYNLYQCHNEEDIQKFKKYYSEKEELCTFLGGRLKKCYVFFAVKDNAEELKREDFKNPQRQDEYGTSVISIQFTRDSYHTLSIKNRYNHSVKNPDATFSNNLDNIVEGLTESFEKYYGMYQMVRERSFEIPGYVKAGDGKYYKYNYEINNIYYCPNNIIIDNFQVKKYPKEQYLILDYFILDFKNKTISLYDYSVMDSFPKVVGDILRLRIENLDNGYKRIELFTIDGNETIIEVDSLNIVKSIVNNSIKSVDNKFLFKNTELDKLELLNLEEVGYNFLTFNKRLVEVNLPKLEVAGDGFLSCNNVIKILNLPSLRVVGNLFLNNNRELKEVYLPSLEEVKDNFLFINKIINNIYAPKLRVIGNNFLKSNQELVSLHLPSAEVIGNCFLSENKVLSSLIMQNVLEIKNSFLDNNLELIDLDFPYLKKIGNRFLILNQKLRVVSIPNLSETANDFLQNNSSITLLDVPIDSIIHEPERKSKF